jgi:hypothetical protein
MITNYNLFNESLKDKLKGKTEENIIKSLDNLSDSDKIKIIFKYKLSYDLLPDNLTICSDLDCSKNNLTSLPDDLTVEGSFYCNDNQLTLLPDNLTVSGILNCSNNNLTSLPDDLTVGGNIYCYNNQLPKDIIKPIRVKGFLKK